MSISDRISDLLQQPVTAERVDQRIFRPSFRSVGPDCYELTSLAETAEAAIAELRALGIETPPGLVPRLVEAKHNPNAWTRDTTEQRYAITRPSIIRRWVFDLAANAQDVTALVQHVLTRKPGKHTDTGTGGAFVVCLADLQIGKTDRNGGTPELLDQLSQKLDRAWHLARKAKPSEILIADLGDGCERDQNTAQQPYTNDLSVVQQLDLFNAITVRACLDAAKIAPVRFAAVPSNHMQERRNRERVGTAGDDYGVLNARTLARVFATAERSDITVVIPERHSESLTLDVQGLSVGMVHGHQVSNPDRIPDWWAKQTFGDQPLAGARVCLTGHFHTMRLQTVGNGRTWIQAPTMDPGSAWYANLSGEESRRGLLTFRVTDGQIDHLRVL